MVKEIGKSIQQFMLSMKTCATGVQQNRESNAAVIHTMLLSVFVLVRRRWKKVQHPHRHQSPQRRRAQAGDAVGLAGVVPVLVAAAARMSKALRVAHVGVAVIQDVAARQHKQHSSPRHLIAIATVAT